jgi:hypothetical protein
VTHERIERNIETAMAALRSDDATRVRTSPNARLLAESVVRKWFECQENATRRSEFRSEVSQMFDDAVEKMAEGS